MRRGMLLFVGLGGCGVLLLALCIRVAAQYAVMPMQPQPFPCDVENTPLRVVSLASYDGPFWEDGTDREVVDVAAVLIENPSQSMVERGAVAIDWGKDQLVFEFSHLPPQSCTLVLESTAKAFQMPESFRCYGWSCLCDLPESDATVTTREIIMELHNPTGQVIPRLTVYYKHYYAETDTYIGGITYQITAPELQPGESRVLCPDHFSAQGSAIVCLQP